MALWTILMCTIYLWCYQVNGQCSGTLYLRADLEEVNFITSPNYPYVYPHNSYCNWVLTAPTNDAVVVVQIVSFSLECRYDFLYINNGQGMSCSRETGNLYGNDRITLRFTSDGSVTRSGFKIKYFAMYESTATKRIRPPTACGNEITLNTVDTYQMAAPNFPVAPGLYYSVNPCQVTLRATATNMYMNVTIVWMDYNFYQNTGCTGGGLVVYKDSVSNANIVQSVCNKASVEDTSLTLSPDSQTVILKFTTFRSTLYEPAISIVTYIGSAVTVNPILPTAPDVTSACQSSIALTATSTLAYITSPGFPSSYSNNMYCGWKITAPANHIVVVGITTINIERNYDYLTFSDGPRASYTTLRSLSGNSIPSSNVQSTGRYMFLNFRTDSSVTYAGFKIFFYSQGDGSTSIDPCDVPYVSTNLTAYGFSQVLTSGSTNYASNTRMYWLITKSDESKSLGFRFTYVRTEAGYDYLRVYKTHCREDLVYSLSGDKTSYSYSVDFAGRYVLFYFESDNSGNYRGFEMNYYLTDAPADSDASTDEDEDGGVDVRIIVGVAVGALILIVIIGSFIKARTSMQPVRKPIPSANKIASSLVIKKRPKVQPHPLPTPPPIIHPHDIVYPPPNTYGQNPPNPPVSYIQSSEPAYPQTSDSAYPPIAPTAYQSTDVPSAFSYNNPAYPPNS